jgi:D-3-phosphoglycerate dehydrogenase
MGEKRKIVIAIRSFDLQGPAMKELVKAFRISYINTSGNRLTEEDLIKNIRGAEGLIAGTEPYTEKVLKSIPELRVISRVGVGLDNIDLEYAKKAGIIVTNTPDAPVESVAEHTIGLIFSVLKHIPEYNERVHHGDYSIRPNTMLSHKNLGIIGLGRIGQRVASLLQPMGVRILYYDPFVKGEIPRDWARKETLDDLLRESDIVTLHSAPLPGQAPLLGDYAFSQCKRGIILINTARGSLIDENALITALDKKIVSSAGLDVFANEPYHGQLLNYPQVIMTPHVASNTTESRQQMEIEAVRKLIAMLEGTVG